MTVDDAFINRISWHCFNKPPPTNYQQIQPNLQSTTLQSIMSLNDEALMNTLSCTLGAAGYPCGENPINIVSLSLATAGLALVMVSSIHMM